MRYLRIFLLHFQFAFNYRGRAFIWFLIALINPLIVLAFWKAAYASNNTIGTWTFSSITLYYFLLIIANSFLIAHIEDDVAVFDIQRGILLKYLVKPFPYFLSKFLEELPWRIIQGVFGVTVLLIFVLFFNNSFAISFNFEILVSLVVILSLGYCISFIFKLILGISAFWLTDYRGLQQLSEVLILIFAGTIMPLNLFPSLLRTIAYIFPFSYMVYFPIMAIEGKILGLDFLKVIGMQFFWLLMLAFIYQKLWQKGLRKFTGVGQ